MAKINDFNLFKIESNERESIVLPQNSINSDNTNNEPTLSINISDKIESNIKENNKNLITKCDIKSFGVYYKTALILSVFWILLLIYGLHNFELQTFDILQILGLVGIAFVPVVIFFFIAYFVDRIHEIKSEQQLLYPFLKNLLDVDDKTLKQVSQMIKINTESELQNISNRIQDIFKIYANAIKIEADGAISSLKKQLELMTSATIKVSDNSDRIRDQIDTQTKDLIQVLDIFSAKSKDVMAQEDLISKLYIKLNDLSKKTGENLQLIKSLSEEVNSKSNIIDKAGDKSVEAINKVSGSIDLNLDKFIGAITQINASTKNYNEIMINTSQNISNAINSIDSLNNKTKQVSENAENMNIIIKKQSSDLADIVNVVSTQTRLGEASLKHQANVLSETAQALLLKMDDIGKKISITIGNILALSEKISGSFSGLHKSVINNANDMFDTIKKNFNETGGSFEKFKNISSDISLKISDVNSSVNSSVNELKQNFAALNILVEKLKSSSGLDLNNMLKNRNSELDQIINNMDKKFNIISAKVKDQLNNNIDINKTIPIKPIAEAINDIGIITNKLSEISIDIDRIFSNDIQSELWDKYYNGNRTVFIKFLLKELSAVNRSNLQKIYQDDSVFHSSVDKFLKEFDTILLNSMSVEKSKILTSIIMDSNIGKIYTLLKNILKS